MAEMKPFGIDQTTGQHRPVKDGDNLTDNIGDTIEIAITRTGDYAGGGNQVHALYPWSTTPTRLADPASHPANGGRGVSWSPNGEFLAVSHFIGGADTIQIYQLTGNTLNNLLEPSSQPGVPGGQATRDVGFSSNGEFLACAHSGSPNLTIYQRDGSTFIPIATVSSFPASTGQSVAWSPTDEYLAVGETSAPYLVLYRRDDTTFTRLASPASAPTSATADSKGLAWSPQGDILTVAQTAKILNYQLVDGALVLLSDPASVTTGGGGASWSPDGKYLAVGNAAFSVFRRSGTTFTMLSDPQTTTSDVRNIAWSPNGKFLVIGRGSSPGMAVYGFDRSTETLTKLDDPSTTPPGAMFGIAWSKDQQFLTLAGAGAGSGALRGLYQADQDMPNTGVVKIIGQPLDGS